MSGSSSAAQSSGDSGSFLCLRLRCSLSRTACANQHASAIRSDRADRASNEMRARFRKSLLPVQYRPCLQCPIGAAHLRGEPTPPYDHAAFVAERKAHLMKTAEVKPEPRPPIRCMRGSDGHTFTPRGAERVCERCRDQGRRRPERAIQHHKLLPLIAQAARGIAESSRGQATQADAIAQMADQLEKSSQRRSKRQIARAQARERT